MVDDVDREKALLHTQQIMMLSGEATKMRRESIEAKKRQQQSAGGENDDIPPIALNDSNGGATPSTPGAPILTPPTSTLSTPSPAVILPETSIRQIEGFIQTIHKHKDNQHEMQAILKAISGDEWVHQQLEVGLQSLSLEASTTAVPLLSQAKHNNKKVDWSQCTDPYEVDERAFKNYKRHHLSEDREECRHEVGQENTAAALQIELKAKNYEKRKVIKAFRTTGSFEQRRLVLLHFLSDPEIRDIASSIGVNLREVRVARHILQCYRKLLNRSQTNTNKNGRLIHIKRAMVHSLSVAASKTPPKDGAKPDYSAISRREMIRQLAFSSNSSGYRNFTKGEKKRAQIADGRIEGWLMIDEEEERTKFTTEFFDLFENWIENNEMVKISPDKKDTLTKHDRKGM